MKLTSIGFLGGGVVVGVALGWLVFGERVPIAVDVVPLAQPMVAHASAGPQRAPGDATSAIEGAKWRGREETMCWLKAHKALAPLEVFSAGGSGLLDNRFAEVFALTAAERERVQQAAEQAYRNIEEVRATRATVSVAPDNSRARVDLPAVPEAGGRIHDELLREFKEVLGPERFAYFDDLAGDNFEAAFKAFGANGETSDLEKYLNEDGRIWVRFQHTVEHEASGVTGGGAGRFSLGHLSQLSPALARALPQGFLQSSAPAR